MSEDELETDSLEQENDNDESFSDSYNILNPEYEFETNNFKLKKTTAIRISKTFPRPIQFPYLIKNKPLKQFSIIMCNKITLYKKIYILCSHVKTA